MARLGQVQVAEWVTWAVAALTLLTLISWACRGIFRMLRKANHFLDDVAGTDARPGKPAQPGLVEQVAELRDNQITYAAMASQAAEDVATVRKELTRNGGNSTTKDVLHKALRTTEETNALLKRHMANGQEIMAVGVHNDAILIAAIEALGGHVADFREYPAVDTGEEEPHE